MRRRVIRPKLISHLEAGSIVNKRPKFVSAAENPKSNFRNTPDFSLEKTLSEWDSTFCFRTSMVLEFLKFGNGVDSMFMNSAASKVDRFQKDFASLCAKCGKSKNFRNGTPECEEPGSRYDVEIADENSAWRIHEDGPGAEIIRRIAIKRLKGLINLLYAHASIADIVLLIDVLEKAECRQGSMSTATLVESFLSILGIDPSEVLAKP